MELRQAGKSEGSIGGLVCNPTELPEQQCPVALNTTTTTTLPENQETYSYVSNFFVATAAMSAASYVLVKSLSTSSTSSALGLISEAGHIALHIPVNLVFAIAEEAPALVYNLGSISLHGLFGAVKFVNEYPCWTLIGITSARIAYAYHQTPEFFEERTPTEIVQYYLTPPNIIAKPFYAAYVGLRHTMRKNGHDKTVEKITGAFDEWCEHIIAEAKKLYNDLSGREAADNNIEEQAESGLLGADNE